MKVTLLLQKVVDADGVDLAKGGVGVGGVLARRIENAVFVDGQLGGEHVIGVELEKIAGGGVVEADAVGAAQGLTLKAISGPGRGRCHDGPAANVPPLDGRVRG